MAESLGAHGLWRRRVIVVICITGFSAYGLPLSAVGSPIQHFNETALVSAVSLTNQPVSVVQWKLNADRRAEGISCMVRTLVLNAAYEPIHLVSWQKAMCLVFTAKAEVVAEYDHMVRSVSQIFKMPSVVRLKRYVRTFRRTMNARCTRRNILMRDRFTCQYCGLGCSMSTITIDHVMPRSRGGKTLWDNVVAACHPCNRRKADRTPEESGMRLMKIPKRPTWVDLLEESHRDLLECWMPFLLTKAVG